MSLFEEDFDADYDLGNVGGIEFGDIFYLNYYGINVFFYVCGLDHNRVRIYELAKKRKIINGVHAEFLTPKLSPTTSPLVVLKHNSWTKSEFWVETTKDGRLVIPVWDGPLVYQAIKIGNEIPVIGEFYAIHLKEEQEAGILNYYWPAPERKKQKKKQNKNNFNNFA